MTTPRGISVRRRASPGPFLVWVAKNLGGPLSWTHPLAGTLLGFAGIFAGCLVLLRFGAGRSSRSPIGTLEAVYIGVLIFAMGSAFFAGLGRLLQWEESWRLARCQTFDLLFWLSLAGLATLRFHGRSGRATWALGAGVIAWLLLVLVPSHFREAQKQLDVSARIREANDAMRVGIDDPRVYRALLPRVGLYLRGANPVFTYSPFLRSHRLGAFASEKSRLLDTRIGVDLSIDPKARCRGAVTRHDVPVDGGDTLGVRLAGWALDEERREAPAWILISDESGNIIGLGSRTKRKVNTLERTGSRTAIADWTAYAGPAAGDRLADRLTVWGVTEGRAVCRVVGKVHLR